MRGQAADDEGGVAQAGGPWVVARAQHIDDGSVARQGGSPGVEVRGDGLGVGDGAVVDEDLAAAEADQGVDGGARHAAGADDETGRLGRLHGVARRGVAADRRHDADPVGVVAVEAAGGAGAFALGGLGEEEVWGAVGDGAEGDDGVDGADGASVVGEGGEVGQDLDAEGLVDGGATEGGVVG